MTRVAWVARSLLASALALPNLALADDPAGVPSWDETDWGEGDDSQGFAPNSSPSDPSSPNPSPARSPTPAGAALAAPSGELAVFGALRSENAGGIL